MTVWHVLAIASAAFTVFAIGVYVGMQIRVRRDHDYDNRQEP